MEFNEQIRQIRKDSGLTQEAFAEKVHVTRQAVSNWENNKNLPDIETLIVISQTFHVSLDELILGGKEDMHKMTEKLIKDGNEGRKAKMNLVSTVIGGVLMLMGLMCLFIKANSVEYVDKQGILHENFYLLPVGFLFLVVGAVVILTTGIVFAAKRKREADRENC